MPEAKSDSTKRPAGKPAAKPAGKPAAKPAGKPAPAKPASKSGGSKPVAKPVAAKPGAKPAPKPAARPGTAKPAPSKKAPPASAPAPAAAVVSSAAEEENPLHRKLRLRPEDSGVIIAPPRDEDNPLLPLPSGFVVLGQTKDLGAQTGPFDYIHVFARDRAELVENFSLLVERLAPTGSLWVSWMKPSTKMKGGGQPGDLNENIVRRVGLMRGLVDVNLAVLDRDWSALRLVRRKH